MRDEESVLRPDSSLGLHRHHISDGVVFVGGAGGQSQLGQSKGQVKRVKFVEMICTLLEYSVISI